MTTILVSGASGIVGYGVLRSLRQLDQPLRLIGTSIHLQSAAPAFCDQFLPAPRTDDPGYVDWLAHTLSTHQVDLAIPGIDADLHAWNAHRDSLEAAGHRLLLNRAALIVLCSDKWNFYEALHKDLPAIAIPSTLDARFDALAGVLGLPFLLKPRRGFASKGIVRINTLEDFLPHQSRIGSQLMAQSIVGGDDEEYTISVFGDGEGQACAGIALRRTLSAEGFTQQAEVVPMAPFESALAALCALFRPVGPTNFQFRVHQGALKLLEINPRISSATSIRTAFGFNESAMAVAHFLTGALPQQPVIRQGRAVRYTDEVIFYEDRTDL